MLGTTTASNLGVGVGDSVTVGPASFQVVAILAQSGGQAFQNGDDIAVVPITTAQDELTGTSPNSVQRVLLSATSADTVGSALPGGGPAQQTTHHITTAANA